MTARVDGGEHGDPGILDELGDPAGALVGHRVLLAVVGWAGRGGRDVTEPRAGGTREPGAGARAGPPGTTGTFRVNYTDLQPGEVLIASGHTHPYDATEGGHTDVAFSAADLANLVTGAERVKFVQSGATRFTVAKTAEFDALVAAADTVEKKRTLMGEMRETWNAASRASTRRTFQGKVLDAVGAVADRYHLVYYQGSGDDLAKATPWVHVESVAPRLPTDPAALPAVPPQVAATAQQPAAPGGTAAAPPQESWLASVVTKIRGWMGW